MPHQPWRGIIADFDQDQQHLPPCCRHGIERQQLDPGKVARDISQGKAFENLTADGHSCRIGDFGMSGMLDNIEPEYVSVTVILLTPAKCRFLQTAAR